MAGGHKTQQRLMRMNLGVMPDGNEIRIGHWSCVSCWLSFSCDFWLCPIVPDKMRTGSGERRAIWWAMNYCSALDFLWAVWCCWMVFRQCGFFAFPAVFFGAFPTCFFVVACFSCFLKPPVSALFRSFSALFRQFLLV